MLISTKRIISKISEDERPQVTNEVVNYINGKAIVMDDYEDLYYFECPEENVVLGETIDHMLLKPLASLPEVERQEIEKSLIGMIEFENKDKE